ncbi:MAG: RsmD family RNA methyltransferase, partial [Candidatus Gastranaerophilales bacterium]|nr:RsmD family RNA methyltransferase [Candidatus Gastranaerophilales bacterium]
GDSLKLIKNLNKNFDVIYFDPPYMSGIYEQSLSLIKTCGIVILEHITEINSVGYEVIKQKKYGDKYISFLIKS